jgi:hypothetical protein
MPLSPVPDLFDVIVEPRYDTAFIPAAGTAGPLSYFTIPLGQGTSVFATASTKTKSDTNQILAGQLPSGYNFVMLGVRLSPSFNMTIVDSTLALNGAVFILTIGSKDYLTVPARTIPAGTGTYVAGGALAGLSTFGIPQLSNGYQISKKPLELPQTVNYSATLSWPGGAGQAVTTTMAGGTTAGAAGLPITLFLDGYLKRPTQ